MKRLKYNLSLDTPIRFFDGERCWVHPRAGILPDVGIGGMPQVVLTMNLLDLAGSDIFRGMYGMYTNDLGKHWTYVTELPSLNPVFEEIDGVKRPEALSDFWPSWHKVSGKLLGTGHTVVYTPEWKVEPQRTRHTSYAVYQPEINNWSTWQKLKLPDPHKFQHAGAGCCQRFDMPDGNILLPVYFYPYGKGNSSVMVVKCSFNGKELSYLSNGNELSIDDETRGLGESSITYYSGEYFLTIRNDKKGFVTKGSDGLHFEAIKPWLFDDGTDLGNYNTQQHWVTHSDGLYLVYTRRGANNNHVFRHRAPLFMAQVDPVTLRVIRETETILVPERGARLGNFGVTNIGPKETWVTVSEWMQPKGVEKYGSDGSIFIARIHWNKPNRLFNHY